LPQTDEKGKTPFRHKLLDYNANGGAFVVGEGAIGKRGKETMNWQSLLVEGDKDIYLHEFPGHVIEIPDHEDFHMIITNNPAEETEGRQALKSEIASNVLFIHVEEADSFKILGDLFSYCVGEDVITPEQSARMGDILAVFHTAFKPLIEDPLG